MISTDVTALVLAVCIFLDTSPGPEQDIAALMDLLCWRFCAPDGTDDVVRIDHNELPKHPCT